MRRLNVRLFLILLGGTVVVSLAVFLTHWLQQGSVARALLVRAEKAEKEDRLDQVVRYVSRYLEMVPDDLEERARLARTLATDQMLANPKTRARAALVIEQVLNKDASRTDLRLRLVRVYILMDRLDKAQQQLDVLQTALKDNGEVDYLSALVAEGKKDWAKAAECYRKANQHAPHQLDSYVRLADLLRRHPGPDLPEAEEHEADHVMERLVKNNAKSAPAHLARWAYGKQWLSLKEAVQIAGDNVRAALELAPESADALLAAAELAQVPENEGAPVTDAQAKVAGDHLRKAQKLHPQDVRPYRELALLELRRGEQYRPAAIESLRAGIKVLSGPMQAELRWTLANLLLDMGKTAEAQPVIAEMIKSNASAASIDYLNARVCIRQGNWSEAVKLLERTRPRLTESPELSTQVDLLLAQCFEQLDDTAAQLSALVRIRQREPNSIAARLNFAAAKAAHGKIDEALTEYAALMNLPGAPREGWITIARLIVMRDLQKSATTASARPPEPNAWNAAEEALDRAEKENPGSVDLTLLRAEVLVAQGKVEEASKLLTAARDKEPKRVELWAALAALAALPGGAKDFAAADELLNQAEKGTGDTADLRLIRARFWLRRGGDEASKAIAQFGRGVEKFPEADRARLLGELAETQYRLGNLKEAGAMWNDLAQMPANKNDLRLRMVLFDLALQTADEAAMQRILGELQRIEGGRGVMASYAAAARLIWKAKHGDTNGLEQAATLLNAVQDRRRDWPSVYVARADLEETRKNYDQAIALYREARDLGERSPRVMRRYVQLLYQQQRANEADQVVKELLERQIADPAEAQQLMKLAVGISLQRNDGERVVQLLENMVSDNSTDYRDFLWQGQVLAAGGLQPAKAEAALRKAVKLGEKEPETWVALVQLLARANQTKEAEKAITQAKAKLAADKAALTLAQCYEAIGKADLAEENFKKAVSDRPKDVLAIRSLAVFYVRNNRAVDARAALSRIINGQSDAGAADVAWARQALAQVLAMQGDWRSFQEALPLVGLKLDSSGRISEDPAQKSDDVEVQRARARVLASQQWREARKQAIATLEALSNRRALAPDDQFLLAQLYDADGAWPKALSQLGSLESGRNPGALAYFAQAALRHGNIKDAERCVDRLDQLEKAAKVAPNTCGAVELRALVLEANGQGDQAVKLLEDYAEKSGQADKVLLLIGSLARQKRYPEALARCEAARATCKPEMVAAATVSLLRASRANAAACDGVERWLRGECAKAPKSAVLWMQLADLRDLQEDYSEAVKILADKVLKLDERNIVALNNLAWLKAQKADTAAEGLGLINRAIDLVGPRGELLDTRATVYLAMNRADLAITDLLAASTDSPSPVRDFHLAQAQLLARQTKEASDSLRKATTAGLKLEHLHPAERAAFSKLLKDLEQR